MDDFKQLTEQLLKFYIDTESVDDIGFENFFDDNSSIIGTGKHEFFRNLHEFQESYKFDVKQRGKIRLKIRDLQQEEAELGDDQVLAYGSVVFTGLFEDGSVCFEMDTRFSIIYKKVNGKWLVQHLHQSVPDRDQMTGEEFPVTLGKQVEEAHRAISGIRDRLLSHLTSRFKDKEDRTCEKIPENGAGHFSKKRRLGFAV